MDAPPAIVSPARFAALWPLAALFLLVQGAAQACTIPVFRYALDRWQSDPYHLLVPAAVASKPDTARLLIPLRGNAAANVRIETAPAGESASSLLPGFGGDKPMWSGALDAASLGTVLESPKRAELIKRILDGESVIWVVVAGDSAQDKASVARIARRLKFLEQVVQIPPQDPQDPDSQLGPGPPLRLKLSTMEVSRNDAAEKLLCSMLAGPKCADALARGECFAAAVFGRGRVLGAWPVSELDDAGLEDATMFLTGRCSCRVKDQSPGWDVLLRVDWETALQKASEARAAPRKAAMIRRVSPRHPVSSILAPAAESASPDDEFEVTDVTITSDLSTWQKVAIYGGGVIGVIALTMLWIRR